MLNSYIHIPGTLLDYTTLCAYSKWRQFMDCFFPSFPLVCLSRHCEITVEPLLEKGEYMYICRKESDSAAAQPNLEVSVN